jgi:hypothetical protein
MTIQARAEMGRRSLTQGGKRTPGTRLSTSRQTVRAEPERRRRIDPKPSFTIRRGRFLVGGIKYFYSTIISPVPPNSVGKSLNFGNPSFIGRTVS